MDDSRRHLHVVAGPRDAGKVALVPSKRRQPRHHLVAFCDLVLDDVTPRCRVPEDLKGRLHSFAALRDGEGRRTVVDVVFGDQLVHGIDIAFVDLLVEPPNECFVLLGGHVSLLPRWGAESKASRAYESEAGRQASPDAPDEVAQLRAAPSGVRGDVPTPRG